jgi:hypothetical protein
MLTRLDKPNLHRWIKAKRVLNLLAPEKAVY